MSTSAGQPVRGGPSTVAQAGAGAWSGVWLIVFTLLSWASVPLFLRYMTVDLRLDPFTANGWRYGISAAFWLPVLVWAARRSRLPRRLLALAIVPTLFNIAGQTTFAWGPALLDPGFFTFVFRVQIVFVTFGAYLMFPSERGTLRSPKFWLGTLLVVAGSAGLVLFKDSGAAAGGAGENANSTLGIVVAILAGALFAGYGLSVRKFVSEFNPVISFGVICQFTAVGMIAIMLAAPSFAGALPASLPTPDPAWPVKSFGPHGWALLVASAFIGIAISHVTYYASIRRLGVSVSIGVVQLQPIFTAAGSLVLFDERMNGVQWCFGVVGVVGAIIMLWSGRKRDDAAASAERRRSAEVAAEGEGS